MSERREHWDAIYATKGPDQVSWFESVPAVSLKLIEEADPAHTGSVLDIGAGDARLAEALLDRGWTDITVLDISENALSRARERLGNRANDVTWIAADVTRWEPDRPRDIVHDRAVFHFLVDPGDRAAYRRMLEAAVTPGGHVVIGTFAPDGPEECSGLPVARYDDTELAHQLGDEFALEAALRHRHTTPWGSTQSFQFTRFRRT